MKRAARSMRSGSSVKLTSGASGVRSRLATRSAAPPNGIDELRRARPVEPQRHGVDGEVAPRQIGVDDVGVDDLGLARVRVVDLGPVGRDLEAAVAALGADRAEALALGPHRVGPAGQDALGLGRPGVGGAVVVAGDVAPEQQVAHGPADEVELVAGGDEPLGERLQLGQHRGEAFGDHGRRRLGVDDRRPQLDVPPPPPPRPDRRWSAGSGRTSTPGQRAEGGRRRVGQRLEVVAALEEGHEPAGGHERRQAGGEGGEVAGAEARGR